MKYGLGRAALVSFMFAIAMYFEQAVASRRTLMFFLMLCFIVMPIIRNKLSKKLGWTLLIDVVLVNALIFYSRFNTNYIFLLMHLWIILEALLWQSQTIGVPITVVAIITSLISQLQTLRYAFNYQTLSQSVFITLIFVFFAVMMYFLKSYLDERAQVRFLNDELTEQNERLNDSNEALLALNEALENANMEVVRLTRLKERSQIAKDLHDTLGHELTGLIMSLEMTKMTVDQKDHEAIKSDIQLHLEHARKLLRAMREVVESHKEVIQNDTLYTRLAQKIEQFQNQTGVHVYLTYDLFDQKISDELCEVFYRTVLESMTNTAKHSASKKMWVSFQSLEDQVILLKIHDDSVRDHNTGDGASESGDVIKGNGLRFIEDRIHRLNGTVSFECDGTGFKTTVKVKGIKTDDQGVVL